jgi:membrane fusion protein, multidrug efflux system
MTSSEANAASSAASDKLSTHPEAPVPATPAPAAPSRSASRRRWWIWILGVLLIVGAAAASIPWIRTTLATVSTDDAYVNGHVTMVAPRVRGQVVRVLVDDNNRVHQGDLLVELDKEPYQVQVDIAQAAVDAAQADVVAAQADVRATEGLARSLRFNLEHSIEDVENRVALLRSRIATLQQRQAALTKAQADYDRNLPLSKNGTVSQQEFDSYRESLLVSRAQVEEALAGVHQIRASLGLPAEPPSGEDLAEVPADLDQTFSSVREAQAKLIQVAAQLGVTGSFNRSPKQMVADFYSRDPQGDIDRIYAQLLKDAPAVKQAESKLAQAEKNLAQAKLDLRYTNIVAEIDGVVTRRGVNPGDNVAAGQALMAIRSLDEIWIDANFKETQLADLRIGLPVDLDIDMYGGRHVFKGRISGFTMGTGSTLALLPAENATGNFVKVVQRLPVRIDLIDYDPDKLPLFIGLSVTPYVYFKEAPTGPNAGKVLQPYQITGAEASGAKHTAAARGDQP